MEINNKTVRTVNVVVSPDEIQELIAFAIRQKCNIPVEAKNIMFNFDYDEDDYGYESWHLNSASYFHTEVLE